VDEGTPRLLLEGRRGSARPGYAADRQVVGKVFFAHDEPTRATNERSMLQPLRGRPLDSCVERPSSARIALTSSSLSVALRSTEHLPLEPG
jgi:hypothetical protein